MPGAPLLVSDIPPHREGLRRSRARRVHLAADPRIAAAWTRGARSAARAGRLTSRFHESRALVLSTLQRSDSPGTIWTGSTGRVLDPRVTNHETHSRYRRRRLYRLPSLRSLLDKGYAVTALDNLVTGRAKNLESAQDAEFHFRRSRRLPAVRNPRAAASRRSTALHGVFHFACPASPVDFDRIPFEILAVDSIGTMNTVELALKHGARYLVASTSEIYGDPLVHPQTEEYWGNVNTIGPRACYDEAKRFSEATSAPRSRLGTGGAVQAAERQRWCASSIPTARACGRTTVAWFPSSACRCSGQAADPARRRQADAKLLLRHGSGGRHRAALRELINIR